MKTPIRRWLGNSLLTGAAAVLAMVAVANMLAPQPVRADKPMPITIVDPLPVPVTGTLGIGGTVSVNVANTPTVKVQNTDTPLFIQPPPEIPYQQTTFFNQGPGTCTDFVCPVTFPAVPAGFRLVVTYVSARFALSGDKAGFHVRVGNTSSASILLPAPVPIGFDRYEVGSPVTFYFGSGQQPIVQLEGQFVTGVSNTAEASIVGHLVPAS